MSRSTETMERIVALCRRRGFIFGSSEIYGGIGGFWDYGPLGTELSLFEGVVSTKAECRQVNSGSIVILGNKRFGVDDDRRIPVFVTLEIRCQYFAIENCVDFQPN